MNPTVKKTLDDMTETERMPYNALHALRLVQVKGRVDRYETDEPPMFGREHALRYALEKGDLVLGEHRDLLLRKRRHYELSEQGKSMLETEIAKLDELGAAVIAAVSEAREKLISDAGYAPHDYIVKRLLFAYGAFDDTYGFFDFGHLGERFEKVLSKTRKLKKRPIVKAPVVVEAPAAVSVPAEAAVVEKSVAKKARKTVTALPIIVHPAFVPVVSTPVPEISRPVPEKRSWWRMF